jgi:hypothetical protein
MSCWAQPVWHCSRNGQETAQNNAVVTKENDFSIATINASTNVIGVSINDLIDIYSGVPVRVSGIPLSACFSLSDRAMTAAALTSLGLQTTTIQALARKSSIIQSNLYPVENELQMAKCITQHFPAVGYLQTPTNTDDIQPCF